jgi:formate hydrogenlyase transcriptional activator
LENIIAGAVILRTGPFLHLADKLDISFLPVSAAMRTREEMARSQILKILSDTRWHIEGKDGAAALLGLRPLILRARMNKLEIIRPERI